MSTSYSFLVAQLTIVTDQKDQKSLDIIIGISS